MSKTDFSFLEVQALMHTASTTSIPLTLTHVGGSYVRIFRILNVNLELELDTQKPW